MNAETVEGRARNTGIELTDTERNEKANRHALAQQWIDFLNHPTVEKSLNVRIDLSLRQRRKSELETRRPPECPTVQYFKTVTESANTGTLIVRQRIARIGNQHRERHDDVFPAEVSVPSRRLPLWQAAICAPYYYLTEDEARRVAVRLMNRLNKEVLGNVARRSHDRQRLTALICQHDRGTRRHLHCLLALPDDVPFAHFIVSFYRACRTEPFLYRRHRIERVENLAGAVVYNLNDRKSLFGSSILYLHVQPNTSQPFHERKQDDETAHHDSDAPEQHHHRAALA